MNSLQPTPLVDVHRDGPVPAPTALFTPPAAARGGPDAPHGTAAPGPTGPWRLLLVDDDEDLRDITAQLLADMGYDVLQAAGGAAALALLDDGQIDVDLVLADFAMPGMNGAELRRRLHACRPGLRVVILTGHAALAELQDIEKDMVLQKPLPKAALAERLGRWLPVGGRGA